jgi:hypothetical protein
MIGLQDQVFAAEAQRFMAERAGARLTEIISSQRHLPLAPGKVTMFILRAARSVG